MEVKGGVYSLIDKQETKTRVGIDTSHRSVAKVDADPDLVHMEMQDTSGGFLYVTCLIQNCSDKMVTAQFLGKIDHNSLAVQDDYIFVKVTTGNRTKHYVSYRRNEFVQMKFPKYALPKDVQIVSTDENQVFLALQEWYQTDTYNLYQSDPQGVYYSIVLENVRSTKQPEENVLIDILEVRGIKGVFLANQKVDGKVTTLITFNKGRDWDYLNPPSTDMNGKPVNCKPGDTLNTKYQVDLGDGFRAIYVNLTVTDEPIQHRYEKPGIYRVTVKAENTAGHDEAMVYIQVNSPLQEVHLEVVPIAGRNQEVNLTAVILPAATNLTVFYWWIGDNLQPILSLENSLITKFPKTGEVMVTVQAACGRSMVQDTKTVQVFDQFQVLPLKFSKSLDPFNPNIPDWRADIGQVVTRILAKITDIPQASVVTVVKPDLPTTADLYVLPPESTPEKKRSTPVDKRIPAIKQALNGNNVSFIVRGGLVVFVNLADSDSVPSALERPF
ncbi:UNVERIFIED_CONTAM: hypothetical protein FKN15_049341 [Acipenser sinensis]